MLLEYLQSCELGDLDGVVIEIRDQQGSWLFPEYDNLLDPGKEATFVSFGYRDSVYEYTLKDGALTGRSPSIRTDTFPVKQHEFKGNYMTMNGGSFRVDASITLGFPSNDHTRKVDSVYIEFTSVPAALAWAILEHVHGKDDGALDHVHGKDIPGVVLEHVHGKDIAALRAQVASNYETLVELLSASNRPDLLAYLESTYVSQSTYADEKFVPMVTYKDMVHRVDTMWGRADPSSRLDTLETQYHNLPGVDKYQDITNRLVRLETWIEENTSDSSIDRRLATVEGQMENIPNLDRYMKLADTMTSITDRVNYIQHYVEYYKDKYTDVAGKYTDVSGLLSSHIGKVVGVCILLVITLLVYYKGKSGP